MAHLHINDASEDWTWWLEVDGANITDPVRMDGTIEAPNEKNISMWILIPTNAPAGGLNTITVEVSHEDGVEDRTPENNALEVIMSTEAVSSLAAAGQPKFNRHGWNNRVRPSRSSKRWKCPRILADGGWAGIIHAAGARIDCLLQCRRSKCPTEHTNARVGSCRWFTNTATGSPPPR